MSDPIGDFTKSATGFSQSPLGIIALFIVLVYGLASQVLVFGSSLDASDKHIIVFFLVLFPLLVLFAFTWLVTKHYNKLFGPSNFRNEANFQEFVKMQVSAAASLTAAASKTEGTPSNFQIEKIVDTVGAAALGWLSQNEAKRQILWVDDNPQNNILERRAFEAIGVKFKLALSTDEALICVGSSRFDAIISDMGRKEGPREGYVLLDTLRKKGIETPLFFYASSNAPEHKRETELHGGQGCTNDGQELFAMVMKTIASAPR